MFRFLRDESGPTTVEYAIMISLILIAVIGAVSVLGTQEQAVFTHVHTEIGGALDSAP